MTDRPDQNRIIDFLSTPQAHSGQDVRRIETHISQIFLAGDRAYKLKKELCTEFLDYSSLEKRHQACEEEVTINRRTAPELYLGVIAVTSGPSGLELNGSGEPVEWLVEMKRFEEEMRFDHLAQAGHLTPEHIEALADEIAEFHKSAEARPQWGGAGEVARLAASLLSHMNASPAFETTNLMPLSAWKTRRLGETAAYIETRRAHGFVRHCHGDLHLANICLVDETPRMFDAIEFSERIASIDCIYDLAFTVMDLLRCVQPRLANRLLNRYFIRTGDYGGLRLLPLFIVLRALVRARVLAMANDKENDARDYLALAQSIAGQASSPRLVAIGGLSGTGKTTLARSISLDLSPAPGAIMLHSDAIRKRIFGVRPEEKLPSTAYSTGASARVYTRMFRDAARALRAGFSVILDATFREPEFRAQAEQLASKTHTPFYGFWLTAPPSISTQRVRSRGQGLSDADAGIAAAQHREDIGIVTWHKVQSEANTAVTRDKLLSILE